MSDDNDKLLKDIEVLKAANKQLASLVDVLNEKVSRYRIVVGTKLTRRQQKIFPTWLEAVDFHTKLKLKSHFPFPKVGLRAIDRGKYVVLTGTEQKEGLTKDEGVDICEYLNSFPENQHMLKNMDSEFRDDVEEAKMREELKK